ncbi:MAG: GNAT family N-acetyltransferase [Bacteroidota bacterium]
MASVFKIVNSELSDLPSIVQWFDDSIAYQEKHGYPTWKNYDQSAIVRDIENRNYYKAINENGTGIAFGVNYRDPILWRHMDDGLSIYLHRIVVNPAFKGQKLFGVILDWAIDHIKQKGLKNIRMDTWSDNPGIINYYKNFGFEVIEDIVTPDTEELPVHNRKLALTLMEYRGDL